jgi:hypothetical protein
MHLAADASAQSGATVSTCLSGNLSRDHQPVTSTVPCGEKDCRQVFDRRTLVHGAAVFEGRERDCRRIPASTVTRQSSGAAALSNAVSRSAVSVALLVHACKVNWFEVVAVVDMIFVEVAFPFRSEGKSSRSPHKEERKSLRTQFWKRKLLRVPWWAPL